MIGRDPGEKHRASTPLELLFDLTLVVAFAQAGDETAHLIAEGHVGSAVLGFVIVAFAVVWAWINFSWFASAFDTDDWFYRITTMVQMVGVIVLALGIPDVFESIDHGGPIDNTVVVAGYVVMRLAMLAQWIRVARQDPAHRSVAVGYAVSLASSCSGRCSPSEREAQSRGIPTTSRNATGCSSSSRSAKASSARSPPSRPSSRRSTGVWKPFSS